MTYVPRGGLDFARTEGKGPAGGRQWNISFQFGIGKFFTGAPDGSTTEC